MPELTDLEQKLKSFVLKEFLPGEDPAMLQKDTPLISSGVLDSIATLQLVTYLEQEFSIALASHETGADYFDTLEKIATLVVEKGGKSG